MEIGLNWLPETAFTFFVIFARIGTLLMLMPSFGERVIPGRLRLSFALMFSLMIYPVVASYLPVFNDDLLYVIRVMGHEILVGLILGGIARIVTAALETAGAIIAFQTGLSVAQAANPLAEGVQGAIFGSFLSFLAMAMIFATDLHHVVLAAVYNSYVVFPVNAPLMFGDAAMLAIDVLARAFVIGTQMAAPFIVFGLVFYLGLGLLAKLMPQLQVFFIAMPANIGIGLILFGLLLTMIIAWYLNHFENEIIMLGGR